MRRNSVGLLRSCLRQAGGMTRGKGRWNRKSSHSGLWSYLEKMPIHFLTRLEAQIGKCADFIW